MTFEEKKQQYLRTELLDFVNQNRIGHQDESLAFQTASMAFNKSRQETLREVKDIFKDNFWDRNLCESAIKVIEELEAEREG